MNLFCDEIKYCSGLNYPKDNLFNFEDKITAGGCWLLLDLNHQNVAAHLGCFEDLQIDRYRVVAFFSKPILGFVYVES